MKNIFAKYLKVIAFVCVAFTLFIKNSLAQQTVWIEQELPQTMSGNALANRGDDVLVFTRNLSDVIFFFDTRINSWTEVNLGTQQTFQKVLASGNTAFAYSDDYIIGYSSILSQWDTLRYDGNVIDPIGVSITKGFGCGDLLAYFVTDANIFYVFDAELAQWNIYNYGIVLNASNINRFWAADVYAGAIFHRNGTDYAKNVTYSLITHSFAEQDQGGWYYYPDNIMYGGYVASWGDGVSSQKYIGYSAYTNQFDEVTFPSGFNVGLIEAWIDNTSFPLLEDIYVFTCGYVVGDQFNRDATIKSFSTKTGNWHSLQYSYDPNEIIGTSWKRGGSFSVGEYYHHSDLSVSVWKFYGNSGTHIGENTGLYGSQAYFICGGKVSVGVGQHNLWFHNFETGSTKNEYHPPNPDLYFSGGLGAENYCCIFRAKTTSDTMRVFFFNSRTNNLQSVLTYKLTSSNPTATPRVYGYRTGGPNNEIIFYSEEKDSIVIYDATETYGSLSAHNFLIAHTLGSSFTLFDASTCVLHEKNFQIVGSPFLGDSLLFTKSGDMELVAYSGITKNWSTLQTDQIINAMHIGDEIGIGASVNFAKYWGYSAYNDTYYELVPEGNWLSPWSMAGGKTAIVMRTDRIYAFSPGNTSSVDDDYSIAANNYTLFQNYPNPFNPSTKIVWQSPVGSHQTIKVFDVLGNEILTLIDEDKPAGRYEVEFNNSALASGVYFYQLRVYSTDNGVSEFIETKKMVLIK
jgi:hypothetical protein